MAAVPKVTFIGAGSAVFARQLITDILAFEGLDAGEFALVGVDVSRLELARGIAERLVEPSGKRWRVVASTDRRGGAPGSRPAFHPLDNAGVPTVAIALQVPHRY